jgi:hypothetical protein
MEQYKILKVDYYNRANLISTRYQVQKKRKVFGFTVWSYVSETLSGWADTYLSRVSFETAEEAEVFVSKLLNGNPIEGETITEVKKIVSNENFPR